jgi:hypothetical protein
LSAQFDLMSSVILQNLRVHYIPGFPAVVCDKSDFVAVRLDHTLAVQQQRFFVILLRFLRFF